MSPTKIWRLAALLAILIALGFVTNALMEFYEAWTTQIVVQASTIQLRFESDTGIRLSEAVNSKLECSAKHFKDDILKGTTVYHSGGELVSSTRISTEDATTVLEIKTRASRMRNPFYAPRYAARKCRAMLEYRYFHPEPKEPRRVKGASTGKIVYSSRDNPDVTLSLAAEVPKWVKLDCVLAPGVEYDLSPWLHYQAQMVDGRVFDDKSSGYDLCPPLSCSQVIAGQARKIASLLSSDTPGYELATSLSGPKENSSNPAARYNELRKLRADIQHHLEKNELHKALNDSSTVDEACGTIVGHRQ